MTDTSYHIAIWIGIGIGIGISKILNSVLGIESIRKRWYRSTFNNIQVSLKILRLTTENFHKVT